MSGKDLNYQYYLHLLLCLSLLVMPLGQASILNLLFLAVFVGSIIALKASSWKKAFGSALFIYPAVFYLFHCLSLTWSADPIEGLKQLETKMSLFIAPLILVANRELIPLRLRINLLKSLVVGCSIAGLGAIGFAFFRIWETDSWYFSIPGSSYRQYYLTYEMLAEPFMHPGYLSVYVGVAILSLIYFIWKKTGFRIWLSSLILIFLLIFLFMLQGRMNILALMLVFGVAAMAVAVHRRQFFWLLLPTLPLVIFLVMLVSGSTNFAQRYVQLPNLDYDISGTDFNSATYRLAEWKSAMHSIAKRPWIGSGVGANREALFDSYRELRFWQGLKLQYNAHNQYLETSIATGIIGLTILLACLLYFFFRSFKQRDYLCMACLLFFALSMLTESMLERANAVILFSVFFPLLLISSRAPEEPSHVKA